MTLMSRSRVGAKLFQIVAIWCRNMRLRCGNQIMPQLILPVAGPSHPGGFQVAGQRGSILQVAITCRHGSIDDDTRAYITRKSEKLLHHFERVTEIDVTVDFAGDSDRVSVEILVDAEHRHNFVASVESKGEASQVFDTTLHKMDRQIRRYKQKIQDHRRDKPTHELTRNPLDEQ